MAGSMLTLWRGCEMRQDSNAKHAQQLRSLNAAVEVLIRHRETILVFGTNKDGPYIAIRRPRCNWLKGVDVGQRGGPDGSYKMWRATLHGVVVTWRD